MKTSLQAARKAQRWTQADLLDRLAATAERIGEELPDRSSLKTQISMFENGRREPGPKYRKLFREVYQATNADLGFAPEDAGTPSTAAPTLPHTLTPGLPAAVSPPMVDYLQAVFAQHAEAEPLVGPRFLVPAVRAQLPLIEQMCRDASGAIRDDVLHMGSRYSEFLGWLYQDLGDSHAAMEWTNLSMDYAQELDNPIIAAYTLQRRSNIAAEAGHAGHGVGLANAAARPLGKLPHRVQAVVLRALANAHSLLGDADECARTLDRARAAAERGINDDDRFAMYCTPSYIEMEAATCSVRLHDPAAAIRLFEDSLQGWPAEQERDRGLCLARLATAHAVSEDVESAYERARQAVDIAQATGSARIRDELFRLQTHLAPWRKLVEIAELNQTLGTMKGT
ncbi:helix-turn-helix transcriptional regulator [Streptomyces abikoensis]|uniref:helix-turn-helix domain-containing protein n=1 Tax=Streptomyces abikoensis TaxID=97398 RepID=UPI003400A04E